MQFHSKTFSELTADELYEIFAVEQSLVAIKEKMKPRLICCDAQSYCSPFYEKFGFVAVSDEFLEEGISHIKMEKKVC